MKVASRVDFVDRFRIPGETGRAATRIDDRASPAPARSIARLLASAHACAVEIPQLNRRARAPRVYYVPPRGIPFPRQRTRSFIRRSAERAGGIINRSHLFVPSRRAERRGARRRRTRQRKYVSREIPRLSLRPSLLPRVVSRGGH